MLLWPGKGPHGLKEWVPRGHSFHRVIPAWQADWGPTRGEMLRTGLGSDEWPRRAEEARQR